jgi:hypothetical protein
MIGKQTGTLILALLSTLPSTAAEYQGRNIDGRPFAATLVELNNYRYKGTVTFKGKAAVLHVRKAITVSVNQPKSKEVRLLLCNEKIDNPYHIEVATPGQKCSEFPGHVIVLELQIPELDTTEWPK